MVQSADAYVTYEDYLAAEQASPTKHEWLDGVVYAVAGGTLEHSRLAGNMHTALKVAFASCEVFQADAMIFVRATDLSTYADVTLVRGPVEAQKVERNTKVLGEALTNPTVIVEVLSDSTEQYDRGEKFAHYMTIPLLKEYVLVSQDTLRIEVFRRPRRGHWNREQAGAGETIEILGKTVSVDEIYRRAAPPS
jgi:Uma2 family endonuclease